MSSRKGNEEPLKALIFADSCGASESRTFPSTKELLNIPILAWQLGTLARYGVKEAIVLSSQPIDISYCDPLDRIKVTPLSSPSWSGEGDAIRDLERRDGLRPVDDFVLVRQGTVFNVDVGNLVAAHKRRKDVDRNWLITAVFRKGAGAAANGLVIGIDNATRTLVKYVEKLDNGGIAIDVNAENTGLQGGGIFETCSDVVDVGLDVCAPDFLLEFRENFYYDRVRAYIKEKLDGGEAEVFGNRMYAHYVDSSIGEYATRIHSLASLAQATNDVLGGWMSPMTPALINGTVRGGSVHTYHCEYILEQSTIGDGVSVAVGSTIIDSVIGDHVKIGSDVTIRQSIIMESTVIGDNCDVDRSVIEENCNIGHNTLIPRNCYFDAGVCIGPEFQELKPYSLITQQHPGSFGTENEETEDSDDDGGLGSTFENGDNDAVELNRAGYTEAQNSDQQWNEQHVGIGGRGRLIDPSIARRVDSFFIPLANIYDPYKFESDEEDELEADDEEDETPMDSDTIYVNGDADDLVQQLEHSTLEDSRPGDGEEESRIAKFSEEMLETIERAFAEDVELENTTLEINSLKLVYNCSFAETLTGVVSSLAQTVEKSASAEQLYSELDSALEKYNSLVMKFHKAHEPKHHLHVASGLASALNENGTLLMYVYKAMYERDMLDEEGILGWAAEEQKRIETGKGNKTLLTTVTPLIEWLEDSEED